jgi:hypothetical protein
VVGEVPLDRFSAIDFSVKGGGRRRDGGHDAAKRRSGGAKVPHAAAPTFRQEARSALLAIAVEVVELVLGALA